MSFEHIWVWYNLSLHFLKVEIDVNEIYNLFMQNIDGLKELYVMLPRGPIEAWAMPRFSSLFQ